MIGIIGNSAVLVALGIAVAGIVLAVVGVRRRKPNLVQAAYAAAYTNFGLLTVATLGMVVALVTHDFSVSYVSQVGSRSTPLFYTIISLWSALEGSILFWGWVLSLYTAAVVWFNRRREGALIPYAASVLFGVGAFFYLLLAGPANPFGLVWPVPPDGPGPNPLLQNHILMGVHPPLLYLGYVGLAVPFAFATGALLAGEIADDAWIRLSRRWAVCAWAFLTAAIIAGMWWSYEVLGWGGYWAWDPVENASLMPWLTATAYLHSIMVQERRRMLRLWNLNLIAATFLLTILGTFLTRSGILSSVHAFTQGTIGYYFMGFMAGTLLFTFAIIAGNSDALASEGKLDAMASRETVFLLNNLFLTAFTFTVALGTLFPLVAEAMRGIKVSVGGPFFEKMTLPLSIGLLFFMGVGPALPWRRAPRELVRRKLLPPTVAALVVMALALLATRAPYAVLAFGFGAFALVGNLGEFWNGARARMRAHGERPLAALARLVSGNRRRYGGYVAHLGVIAVSVGIAASSTFRMEREATLTPGESLVIGDYAVQLQQVWGRAEPQRDVIGADLAVLRRGSAVGTLSPRLNYYGGSEQPTPTPDVRSRAAGDLYANLMAFSRDGSTATVRVIIEPLVPWIWLGGGIICLGALIAVAPRRRRAEQPATDAVPAGVPAMALAAAEPALRRQEVTS